MAFKQDKSLIKDQSTIISFEIKLKRFKAVLLSIANGGEKSPEQVKLERLYKRVSEAKMTATDLAGSIIVVKLAEKVNMTIKEAQTELETADLRKASKLALERNLGIKWITDAKKVISAFYAIQAKDLVEARKFHFVAFKAMDIIKTTKVSPKMKALKSPVKVAKKQVAKVA
jgi:hypothetical protein